MKPLVKIDIEGEVFTDERGWVTNPLEAVSLPSNKVGNLHVVSIHPNKIRGNHSHPDCREWFLIFDGPALVTGKLKDDDSPVTILVDEDKPAMFEIPPGVDHAIKNISDKIIYLLSFSDTLERETVRCENLFDSSK